jgi:hypothetical protein
MANWEELSDFEIRSCATKRRYIEPPLPSMAYRAYRCSFCDGWHLASKFKKNGLQYRKDGYPIIPRAES